MRKYFFEGLALVLTLGSLGFLVQAVRLVVGHDYVGGLLVAVVGVAVLHVGVELARLALVERDG